MASVYPNQKNGVYAYNTSMFHNKNTIHHKNDQEIKEAAEMSYKASHLQEKD